MIVTIAETITQLIYLVEIFNRFIDRNYLVVVATTLRSLTLCHLQDFKLRV